MAPNSGGFGEELQALFAQATAHGQTSVDVRSGDLHRRVGGYPGPDHRMPACCGVMRAEMREGDEILEQPPKGKGANFVIRYSLPR